MERGKEAIVKDKKESSEQGDKKGESRSNKWLAIWLAGIALASTFLIIASFVTQPQPKEYEIFVVDDPAPMAEASQAVTSEPIKMPTSVSDLTEAADNGRDSLPIE